MKYNLANVDGNAYAIMGYVIKALEAEGVCKEQIDDYVRDAESDDYAHLLRVSTDTLLVLNEGTITREQAMQAARAYVVINARRPYVVINARRPYVWVQAAAETQQYDRNFYFLPDTESKSKFEEWLKNQPDPMELFK